jgi:hypothetical protein
MPHAASNHPRLDVRRAIVIEPTRLTPAKRSFQHTMRRKIRRGPS